MYKINVNKNKWGFLNRNKKKDWIIDKSLINKIPTEFIIHEKSIFLYK